MATFVMIHGAAQGGWIWQPTARLLRAAGHTVYTPTLEGCAERRSQIRQGITTETQAFEIADLLFFEDLHDVVMVATSTGGMVMCKAAELARPRVGRLIFVDAMALLDKEMQREVFSRPVPAGAPPISITPADFFFAESDIADPDVRAWALERKSAYPSAIRYIRVDLPTFWDQEWNVTVIRCTSGHPNPPEAHQRRTAELLKGRYLEIACGHYPMLSDPEILVPLLER
jgi:pimeloyl-ACP methyl ester carboxylesterase